MCSYSNLSKKSRSVDGAMTISHAISHLSKSNLPSLSLRAKVCHLNTRTYVRLLGPCYKTGRLNPFCQHPECACGLWPIPDPLYAAQYLSHARRTGMNQRSPAEAHTAFLSPRLRYRRESVTLLPKDELPSSRLFPAGRTDVDQPAAEVPQP